MLLGVLAAAAGACLALPGVAGAQAPAQDSVVGTGAIADGSSLVANVTSGPSGENPTGTVSFSTAGFSFQSTSVACLSVTGNSATFVISLAPNGLGIPGARFTVVDNSSTGSPDTITVSPRDPFATPCTPEPGIPGGGPQELTAGDIVVIDAQPFPTSKDQCKNGGWRTFGDTFKNQGQCVAFVERGPKP
jgi:hypothetical protein